MIDIENVREKEFINALDTMPEMPSVLGEWSDLNLSISVGLLKIGHLTNEGPDVAIMSFDTWLRLSKELTRYVPKYKDIFENAPDPFELDLCVYGPRGIVKCIPTNACPDEAIYLVSTDFWNIDEEEIVCDDKNRNCKIILE